MHVVLQVRCHIQWYACRPASTVSHTMVCMHCLSCKYGVTYNGMHALFVLQVRCHIQWYACRPASTVSHTMVCMHCLSCKYGVTYNGMHVVLQVRCHIQWYACIVCPASTVSHTMVCMHDFRVLLIFVLSANSTKLKKLIVYENFCDDSTWAKHNQRIIMILTFCFDSSSHFVSTSTLNIKHKRG